MIKKFIGLVAREYQLFKKNNMLKLIILAGPFAFTFLIGFVYYNAKVTHLPIWVVNLDQTPMSNSIIDALNDNQYIRVKKVVYDVFEAREAMQSGKTEGVVTIPANFSADINMKRHPEIQVDLNTINVLTSNYISTGILKTMGYLDAGVSMATLQKKGIPSSITASQYNSFNVNIARHYNPETNYLRFLWPGIVGTILQQIFLMAIALIFTQEFEKGTFAELITRTKSSTLMIFGKATPYLLYMIAIWAVILYIVFPMFKIEVIGAFGNVALVSLLFMLSLLAFGIMVSVFCRTQLLATDILMIISAPSFIISGYTWPLSQMPGFMQYLANILPLTHFLSAFRKVVFVGVSWHDVKPELQALLILALVYGILAIAVLKIKIYLEAKKSSAVSISQDLPASK